MAYLLSDLIRDSLLDLGQGETLRVTSAADTTHFAVSTLADRFQDNDPNDGFILVTYDAGGAGAAPEKEFAEVDGYVSSSQTFTLRTALTAQLAAGDRVFLVPKSYPLYTVIDLITTALQTKLGDIALSDTSITLADDYVRQASLPVGLKRDVLQVDWLPFGAVATTDPWVTLSDWKVVPSAGGAAATLQFDLAPGKGTLRVWYMGQHPRMALYNDPIQESLPPLTAMALAQNTLVSWQIKRSGGGQPLDMQMLNEYGAKERDALTVHPPRRIARQHRHYLDPAKI